MYFPLLFRLSLLNINPAEFMKYKILAILTIFTFSIAISQSTEIDHSRINQDLDQLIYDLSNSYVYLKDKGVDLNCIREQYKKQLPKIKTDEEIVLFFEYLLDEFYDSHVILNTNRASSFRLFSPIYVSLQNGKPIITSVWSSQIEGLDQNIIGAELLKINSFSIHQAVEEFPTLCNNKSSTIVKEWIINKIVSGRYNEPRLLTLKKEHDKMIEVDLDKIKFKTNDQLLSSTVNKDVGIITINNSLGNYNLINEFDSTLDEMLDDTKGLIVDLRNTVDGGNSYVARAIMGRFIRESKPYQKHLSSEKYEGYPEIERSWMEYVSPRMRQYDKPVVVLVGRWTGSMGEGLAIGLEGIGRAEIVGTEMERLAGEMYGYSFQNLNFGYRLSTAKLYHVDGTLREEYVPTYYVGQSTIERDEIMEEGIRLLREITNR